MADVLKWLLIGWIKGDSCLYNPKRRDDHVSLKIPTAGGEYAQGEIMTLSYRIL